MYLAQAMMENEPHLFKNIKVVVDSMKNYGSQYYASVPDRQFVIENSKIALVGGLGPFELIKSFKKIEKYLLNEK